MSRFPSGCASLAVLAFVSQLALAQRPTISLKPISGIVTKECVGGPDAGQVCTTTADCENDGGGAMHLSCQRLCDGDQDEPCVTSLDCPVSAIECRQQCFCNSVVASPSLFYLTEILASGWSPRRLAGFQVVIDLTDTASRVLPLGWDGPEPPIPCSSDGDCPARYPICSFAECQDPNHDPSHGVGTKGDLPGCEPGCCKSCFVDTSTLRYRFTCWYPDPSCAPVTGPKYLGSLILVPTYAACGTVTITPSSAPESHLVDEYGLLMEPLDIEGLTIEFGGHCRVDCNDNGEADFWEKLEPGDFDFNHTIDLADFAAFQRCFYGLSYGYDDPCPCVFDFNGNLVVDRGDLGVFTAQLAGP